MIGDAYQDLGNFSRSPKTLSKIKTEYLLFIKDRDTFPRSRFWRSAGHFFKIAVALFINQEKSKPLSLFIKDKVTLLLSKSTQTPFKNSQQHFLD